MKCTSVEILTGSSLKSNFFLFTLKQPSVQGLIVLTLVEATGQGEAPFMTVIVVPIALLILFKCYATNNVNLTWGMHAGQCSPLQFVLSPFRL